MKNKKIRLKSNMLLSIAKLVVLIVFVFFAAKVRHNAGAGFIVDGVFITVCIFSAFLFVIRYEAILHLNNNVVTFVVHKNLLGLKRISIQYESGGVHNFITINGSYLFNCEEGKVDFVFTNLNGNEVYVEVID